MLDFRLTEKFEPTLLFSYPLPLPHSNCFPIPVWWKVRRWCAGYFCFCSEMVQGLFDPKSVPFDGFIQDFWILVKVVRNSHSRLDWIERCAVILVSTQRIRKFNFDRWESPIWPFCWFWHFLSKSAFLVRRCLSWSRKSLKITLKTFQKCFGRFWAFWHFSPKSLKSIGIVFGLLIWIREAWKVRSDVAESDFKHLYHFWIDQEKFRFFGLRYFRSVSGPA